ncbi:MAG TPA: UrcA family protein [Novosphingobium sp.]|nr:UrcA family protein [Novosphingobium sp.]
MKNIRLIISAVTVVCMAAPAFAQVVVKDGHPLREQSREVRFGDLDLDTPDGMDRLNTRIAIAVRNVCGSADNRIMREVADMRNCRDQSIKQAFADRDRIVAARMAARGQPEKLAQVSSSIAIAAK